MTKNCSQGPRGVNASAFQQRIEVISGDLNFVQIGRFEIRRGTAIFFTQPPVEISSSAIVLLEPTRDAPVLSRNRASDTSIFKPTDFHDFHAQG
jgi:hypothetical protein